MMCCCELCVDRYMMTEVCSQQWGEVPGLGTVDLWVLKSPLIRVEILTLGAIIKSVYSKGSDGQIQDVVLGYDDLNGRRKYKCDTRKKVAP